MVESTEEKIVFCIANGKSENDPMTLLLGVPNGAWQYMKDGKTNHFTLESLGIPIRIIMYGAETHEKAMGFIHESAAKLGIPLLDERRKDFSIPEAE